MASLEPAPGGRYRSEVAVVDFAERQVTLKLVYYGPPMSGKTTNLRWIHDHVDHLNRGRLMTLDTRDDRTLFFDLLPLFFKLSALSFRVKVYTVPGQPLHAATRRIVLTGADGVAFVADAQRSEIRANNDSYQSLLDNMTQLSLTRSRVPIVIQYNKLDLEDTLGDAELTSFEQAAEESVFRAAAIDGSGVMDTFFGLLSAAWRALDKETRVGSRFGIAPEQFVDAMRAHLGAPTTPRPSGA